MSKNIEIVVEKFNKLIPDNDSDLIILKGHLLVEEIIQGILEHLSNNKKYLEKANLTFYQKLYLSGALVAIFHPHIFSAIDLLNNIRNKLAHNLEPKNYDKLIADLLGMFEKDIYFVSSVRKEDRLKGTIACICGNLSLMKDELEKTKA